MHASNGERLWSRPNDSKQELYGLVDCIKWSTGVKWTFCCRPQGGPKSSKMCRLSPSKPVMTCSELELQCAKEILVHISVKMEKLLWVRFKVAATKWPALIAWWGFVHPTSRPEVNRRLIFAICEHPVSRGRNALHLLYYFIGVVVDNSLNCWSFSSQLWYPLIGNIDFTT